MSQPICEQTEKSHVWNSVGASFLFPHLAYLMRKQLKKQPLRYSKDLSGLPLHRETVLRLQTKMTKTIWLQISFFGGGKNE